MSLIIRKAKPEDYDALLPLFQQVHGLHVLERPDIYTDTPTPVERDFYMKQMSDDKQHIFVASIGTNIDAVVVMKEEEVLENSFVKARKILVVNSLCVEKEKRGTGIGKAMMEFVFDYGRKIHVDSIELGVSNGNKAAMRFYESLGLRTKSRRMEFRL